MSKVDLALIERFRRLRERLGIREFQGPITELPEELLLKILSEQTLGGSLAAVSRQIKRIREDGLVWKLRASELGLECKRAKTISTKTLVRAELDWPQNKVLSNAFEMRFPPPSYCATGGTRTAFAWQGPEDEWKAIWFDHRALKGRLEESLDDFGFLVDSENYLAMEEDQLQIVELDSRDIMSELPRPVHWLVPENSPPIVRVEGDLIYEARGNRVRIWSKNGSGQRDLIGNEGESVTAVERQGRCIVLHYRTGHNSLFVGNSHIDLQWTISDRVPISFFVGSYFCRFSSGLGLQAYTQEGKLACHKQGPILRAVQLLGDQGAVVQFADGKLGLVLERKGHLSLERLELELNEDDSLKAAARPRPGLVLIGFESKRLVVMRTDNMRVVDDWVLQEQNSIYQFYFGGDKRVMVECDSCMFAYCFDNPLDYHPPRRQQ